MLSPKQIAMVLARIDYRQRYITRSKNDEEAYVRAHWRTFHQQALAVKKYVMTWRASRQQQGGEHD